MDMQEAKTMAIKACHSCGGSLLERDRFCRWCSARQIEPTLRIESGAIEMVSETTPLDQRPIAISYRPISGPLVRAATAGVWTAESSHLSGRIARSAALALISVPIWLMIVLLSPLDAYFVAKTVTDRV